jgi:hypothetical protein
MNKTFVTIGFITVLGACGGGGGGDGGFTEKENAATDLANQLSAFDISPADEIPVAGTANYAGLVGFFEPDYAVIGDLSLGVNFQNDAITGNASNFVDSDGVNYTGSLTVNNGNIDRMADPDTEFQFIADMGGIIQGGGESFSVDTVLEGDFVGPNQEGIAGIVSGSISSPAGITVVEGDFGGLKQ